MRSELEDYLACQKRQSQDIIDEYNGVIFSDDDGKFPEVDSLGGKTVDITGTIKLYQGRTEIILNDPAQIRTK